MHYIKIRSAIFTPEYGEKLWITRGSSRRHARRCLAGGSRQIRWTTWKPLLSHGTPRHLMRAARLMFCDGLSARSLAAHDTNRLSAVTVSVRQPQITSKRPTTHLMGAAPSDPAFRRIGGGIQSDNRKDDIYQGFSEAARTGRP